MQTKEEQIQNRLTHIHWSTYLYNTSISELHVISDEVYSKNEIKIVNSHTFNFYRVTLQYCFIMEYNKLLEKGNRGNDQNISSLNRLNDILLEVNPITFMTHYKENSDLIQNIKDSDFYLKIRTLRDKKFGHADNDEINKPFKFESFVSRDFDNAFRHLRMIKTIFNSFASIYNRQYDLEIPSREDRTRNFIKFHADYQTYYMKNYMDASADRRKSKQNGS
jgi:hypothetical protein